MNTRESQFCYRHPTIRARRRCYFCRRWICPRCQLRRSHHIFCRAECYHRWHTLQQWQRVRTWMGAHAARLIVYPLLALLGLVVGTGLHLWQRELTADLARLAAAPLRYRRLPPAPTHGAIRILSPVFGARLSSNRVAVKGEGPPGAAIRLWVNGEPVQETRADAQGRFAFTDVSLHPRDNLLQLEYRLDDRRFGYSPAVLVYRPVSTRPRYQYVQRSPDNLYRGNPNLREVALTFDGNTSDRDVDAVLAFVEEERVPITVFLTGTFIARFPRATQRLAASPWVEVGNHTVSHLHLTAYARTRRQVTRKGLTPERIQWELTETARRYYRLTAKPMVPLWRAPYGEHNAEIRSWAAASGYTHVGWTTTPRWSLDTLDWIDDPAHPQYRPAREIVRRILDIAMNEPRGINGGILLMHLGSHRRVGDRMVDHLPELVRSLRRMGYRFVFVSTMLRHLHPTPERAAPVATAPAVPVSPPQP